MNMNAIRCGIATTIFAVLGLLSGPGRANTSLPYQVTKTISTGASAVEQAFTPSAAQAGSVDVTVVDKGFPLPLTALRVAVTRGSTVIQTGVANAGSPATVKVTFAATAGVTYTIRLVGRPDASLGEGSALVSIGASGATGSPYLTFGATFETPIASGAAGGVLPNQTLTFPEAGTYTAALTDFALPAPMQALFLTLCPGACTDPAHYINLTAGSGQAPGTTQFTIPAANTTLTLKTIAASAGGGLFGLRITGGPSANVVYPLSAGASGLTAIGNVSGPVVVANPAASTAAIGVADLQFPTSLGTLGAVLTTSKGALIARQCVTSCGTADVLSGPAPAENLLLWRTAVAGTGSGSYVVSVTTPNSTLYTDAGNVNVPGAAASSSFNFPFVVPATGSYTAQVTDLVAPVALASLKYAVLQNGVTVATAGTAGSTTVPLAAGPANLVVIAGTAAGGSGIFGAQMLSKDATPVSLLATSQAVGAFAGFQLVDVTGATASLYDVSLTDGQWPAKFQTLNVFITQGAQILGKVYGGGTISLNLTAGTYGVTYSAVPDATEQAGLYSLLFQASAPPPAVPTVALSADQTSIGAGQLVHLTWASTDATSCNASGGWAGAQATSGSGVAVGPLSASTTLTLTCTGPGGTSTPASVSVTVSATPPGSKSGGGGGSFDLLTLLALGVLSAARRRMH